MHRKRVITVIGTLPLMIQRIAASLKNEVRVREREERKEGQGSRERYFISFFFRVIKC